MATLAAMLTAAAIYVARRPRSAPPCESDPAALKGEVKRDARGRLLYFDGHCWTTKPQPPRDTPF